MNPTRKLFDDVLSALNSLAQNWLGVSAVFEADEKWNPITGEVIQADAWIFAPTGFDDGWIVRALRTTNDRGEILLQYPLGAGSHTLEEWKAIVDSVSRLQGWLVIRNQNYGNNYRITSSQSGNRLAYDCSFNPDTVRTGRLVVCTVSQIIGGFIMERKITVEDVPAKKRLMVGHFVESSKTGLVYIVVSSTMSGYNLVSLMTGYPLFNTDFRSEEALSKAVTDSEHLSAVSNSASITIAHERSED